jgi:hypothetical protein
VYSFKALETLRRQYPSAKDIVAVVALEGQVEEGGQGYRAQGARVVALWARADLAPAVRAYVAQRDYPIRVHDDVERMVLCYAGLSVLRPRTAVQDWVSATSFSDPGARRALAGLSSAANATTVLGHLSRRISALGWWRTVLACLAVVLPVIAAGVFVATATGAAKSAPAGSSAEELGTWLADGAILVAALLLLFSVIAVIAAAVRVASGWRLRTVISGPAGTSSVVAAWPIGAGIAVPGTVDAPMICVMCVFAAGACALRLWGIGIAAALPGRLSARRATAKGSGHG